MSGGVLTPEEESNNQKQEDPSIPEEESNNQDPTIPEEEPQIHEVFHDLYDFLQNKTDSVEKKKYQKLQKVFGQSAIQFNTKFLNKFIAECHQKPITELTCFKNTQFSSLYTETLTTEDKKYIHGKVVQCANLSKKLLFNEQMKKMKKMMGRASDKMKTMVNPDLLNEEKMQSILSQFETGKITPDKLESVVNKVLTVDDNTKSMISGLIKHPMMNTVLKKVSSIIGKVMPEDEEETNEEEEEEEEDEEEGPTNIKEILEELQQNETFSDIWNKMKKKHPEVMGEFIKLIELFDTDMIQGLIDKVAKTFEENEINSIDSVFSTFGKILEGDGSIQDMLWKAQGYVQEGLGNLRKMKVQIGILAISVLDELVAKEIITEQDKTILITLFAKRHSLFKRKPKKKLTKSERKDRRIKNNRRAIKSKLKRQRKKKKKSRK